MKSVLISIKPKWCELTASGKKTVEVRKTRPKIETPFKCYIYQTVGGRTNSVDVLENNLGKVIGEFACDKIDEIDVIDHELLTYIRVNRRPDMFVTEETCLGIDELQKYLDNKTGYGWHISDLVIYDKPKDLDDFMVFGKTSCDQKNCKKCLYMGIDGICDVKDIGQPMTRPPQSWCYVEEVEE